MARNHDTEDVYISLFDYLKDDSKFINQNGQKISLSSRLMPDLDFERVSLNKKQMLLEFIKQNSAFKE